MSNWRGGGHTQANKRERTRQSSDPLQRVQVPDADGVVVGAAEQVRGGPGEGEDGPRVALKNLQERQEGNEGGFALFSRSSAL